jgi:hypothetical protein
MLKQVGKWNNIPKELLPKLPEQGTRVTFNLKNVKFDDLEGKTRFVEWFTFPSSSSFVNPKTGQVIPIALIKETGDYDDVLNFHKINCRPSKTNGTYSIVINESELGDDIYTFLMLASEREDNEYSVVNATPKYVLYDMQADAEREVAERDAKFGAIAHAMNLKDSELIEVALVLGINDTSNLKVVRNEVAKRAEQNPKDYMNKVNDEDKALTALIKKALSLGVVYNKEGVLRWKKGDIKIFELSENDDIVIPREFVRFARVEVQGDLTVQSLKKEIELAQKKATKPTKREVE